MKEQLTMKYNRDALAFLKLAKKNDLNGGLVGWEEIHSIDHEGPPPVTREIHGIAEMRDLKTNKLFKHKFHLQYYVDKYMNFNVKDMLK